MCGVAHPNADSCLVGSSGMFFPPLLIVVVRKEDVKVLAVPTEVEMQR